VSGSSWHVNQEALLPPRCLISSSLPAPRPSQPTANARPPSLNLQRAHYHAIIKASSWKPSRRSWLGKSRRNSRLPRHRVRPMPPSSLRSLPFHPSLPALHPSIFFPRTNLCIYTGANGGRGSAPGGTKYFRQGDVIKAEAEKRAAEQAQRDREREEARRCRMEV